MNTFHVTVLDAHQPDTRRDLEPPARICREEPAVPQDRSEEMMSSRRERHDSRGVQGKSEMTRRPSLGGQGTRVSRVRRDLSCLQEHTSWRVSVVLVAYEPEILFPLPCNRKLDR